MDHEVAVVGGGIVGAAIAYGLARRKVRVLLIDGSDRDLRAANANFGLVWLTGKGSSGPPSLGGVMPEYHFLTRCSVDLSPSFYGELSDVTGIDVHYERNGGLDLCHGEEGLESRRTTLMRLHNHLGGIDSDWEMLSRAELDRLQPKVRFGPTVSGAVFGRSDGHLNPMRMLAALHAGVERHGGVVRGGCVVNSITGEKSRGFEIRFGTDTIIAHKVVIAAGLASRELAHQVGIDFPLRSQRGQLLISERLEPFLTLPTGGLRQTREGTMLMGSTLEDDPIDTMTTGEAAASMSERAIRRIPALSGVNVVRQWAGLRVLSPDRAPIYAESDSHPGAFVAVCHSGVTLAAVHAERVAQGIAAGKLPSSLDFFHHRRFNVSQAA